MVDFRFHLFSVIAVFLALATGMLVGSALPGPAVLAEKQEAAVLELKREFSLLRQRERAFAVRVAALEEEVRVEGGLAAGAVPILLNGRLAERRVVVVAVRERGVADEVAGTLRLAGATVEVVILRPGDGGMAPGLPALPGLLPGDAAVLLAPSAREGTWWEGVYREAAAGLQERGMRVVGGETRDRRPSAIPFFTHLRLSAVDDLDLLAGRAALVYVAAGATGHFGVKAGARASTPPLEAGDVVGGTVGDAAREVR